MTLNIDELSDIVRDVVKEFRDDLDLVSVASTHGGITRVELLVTISGCHRDPCVLLVNVSRAEPLGV
jgi:hypothetical protein